jgi:hypothetical protein
VSASIAASHLAADATHLVPGHLRGPGLRALQRCRVTGVLGDAAQDEVDGVMIIGIDAHKRTHTAVTVDEMGRQGDTKTVASRHTTICSW